MSSNIESVHAGKARLSRRRRHSSKQANVSGMAGLPTRWSRRPSATSRASGRASRARRSRWHEAVHQGARREQGAVLQVVRRRRAERLVQLPRPQSRKRNADKIAIIFEADDGKVTKRHLPRAASARSAASRTALQARSASRRATASSSTCRCRSKAIVAMQACARIGATHSVVFGGFSAKIAAGAHHRRRRGRGDHRRRADARRQGDAAQGRSSTRRSAWAAARR